MLSRKNCFNMIVAYLCEIVFADELGVIAQNWVLSHKVKRRQEHNTLHHSPDKRRQGQRECKEKD